MSKFVMIVKSGINGADVSIRNIQSGAVTCMTFAGPKEELDAMLKAFETNPEYKIKYE